MGGVFLSGLADKLPRRRVMLIADLLRAAMIVPVAVPGMPFPVLCVLVAGVSLLNAPFRAAEQALYADVLPATAQTRGLALMCVASGAPLLVCLLQPGLIVSAVVFVIAGAFGTATYMQTTASIMRGVPDSRRAQVLGLAYAGMMAAQGLSPFVAGLVADRVGAANAVGWFGVVGLLVAAPVAVAWRRATTSRPEIWLSAPESGADTRLNRPVRD